MNLLHNRWLTYNPTNRDRWVAFCARSLPAGAQILDVGAGSCPYRPLFAHCEYRTQDFQQLEGDQLRYGSYGAIDYVCDAASIPVPDASFDAVLCTEMLEHVPDPVAVIRELARILRPGGQLFLTAPLGSGIHQEPYHYFGGFTPWWYERFLADVGFSAIRVEANAGFFSLFGQEALRFLSLSMPFRRVRGLAAVAWAPVWACLLPILGTLPFLAPLLDRTDGERRFTAGYHVSAVRACAAPTHGAS